MSAHAPTNYVKIWGILCVLLVVSIVGPMFEIPVLTLITAFGIALVKAWMVANYFMHLNVEKRIVWYLLLICIVLMFLFYFGVASDIMNHQGTNWINTSPSM